MVTSGATLSVLLIRTIGGLIKLVARDVMDGWPDSSLRSVHQAFPSPPHITFHYGYSAYHRVDPIVLYGIYTR